MATELAKAYVQIVPSARGIKGQLESQMGGEVQSAGNSLGKSLGGAIKGAIAAVGIGKALSAALTEGADLQQSIGGIETLFKDSAETVKKNAAEAYRTAGMSANQYMELTTSFSASLLQSLGGDTAKAADISNMAMTDMSDNANKMGTDMERITDAYQGFAKQNYTMLDNLKLGYGGTKQEMERLLADAQKITGVKYDINNLSDVYSAIHVIQGELGITGTTAKEAASTLSGSFASMQAAFKNVLGNLSLGEDISEELYALQDATFTFLAGNLLPMIGNVLSGLPAMIGQTLTFATLGLNMISNNADQIVAQGAEFVTALVTGIVTNLPYLAEAAIDLVMSLGNALLTADWVGIAQNMVSNIKIGLDEAAGQILGTDGNIVESVKSAITTHLPSLLQEGVNILTNIANGILQNLPYIVSCASQMTAEFLNMITSMLPVVLQKGAQLLINLVNGIINNLPQITAAAAKSVTTMVSAIARNLPKLLQSGIELIGKLAAGMIQAIPNLVGKIPTIIKSITSAFKNVDWGSIGVNIIRGIANGISNAAGMLWDAAKRVLGSFKDKVLGFFGIHSPARWGVYVGKMVTSGMGLGVEKNASLFGRALDSIKDTATQAFDTNMSYTMNGSAQITRSNNNDGVIHRLDTLISMLEVIAENDKEVTLVVNKRATGRKLKEMGVVFA